jgi:hypothetical protein
MDQATKSPTATLTTGQAAAAIVELINGRPISPRQDEIEAIIARVVVRPAPLGPTSLTDAQARLLEAIHDYAAAERAFDEAGKKATSELPCEEFEAAERRVDSALERMDRLAAELPNRSHSIADLRLLGQVAHYHSDRDERGRLAALSDDKAVADEVAVARLIEAACQVDGAADR